MIPKKKESKEKAFELFNIFYKATESIEWTKDQEKLKKSSDYNDDLGNEVDFFWHELAKKSALIAVNYIITSNPHSNPFNTNVYSTMDYWNEVKHEIEKL